MQKENKSYQIYLNGEFVPVTEEVYKEWYAPHLARIRQRQAARMLPLSQLAVL